MAKQRRKGDRNKIGHDTAAHDKHVDKKVARAKAKAKAAKASKVKAGQATAPALGRQAHAAPRVVLTPVEVEVARELQPERPIGELLQVKDGFDLSTIDTRATPGFDGDKLMGSQGRVDLRARDRRVARAAVCRVQGRGEPVTSAGHPGHGHLRQGRHHAPRRQCR